MDRKKSTSPRRSPIRTRSYTSQLHTSDKQQEHVYQRTRSNQNVTAAESTMEQKRLRATELQRKRRLSATESERADLRETDRAQHQRSRQRLTYNEEREKLEANAAQHRRARRSLSEEEKQLISESNAAQHRRSRRSLSQDHQELILESNAIQHRRHRRALSEEQRSNIQQQNTVRHRVVRSREPVVHGIPNARNNDLRPQLNNIGSMNIACIHCGALHFKGEVTQSDNSFNICCNHGNISLPVFEGYPERFKTFLTSMEAEYRQLRKLIRNYNSALAMASMGAQLDTDINKHGGGPYCFRIHGQVYHYAGPLHPSQGHQPRYGQIYVLDTDMAAEERLNIRENTKCDEKIMSEMSILLSRNNPYAQSYFMMSEVEKKEQEKAKIENRSSEPVRLIFDSNIQVDMRRYNVPVVNEVAVVFVGQDDDVPLTRSLAIHSREHGLKIISDIDKICDPMTYPIFYPHGGEGWHPGLTKTTSKKRTRVSQKEYYCYLLFTRTGQFNPLHHANKLFQQYLVDSWVKTEQNRLNYDRMNQKDLRMDSYSGLKDYMLNDDKTEGPPGRRIYLPSTHKGGPRDMHQSYQDAMAIVSKYGKPDLFITMTCNPHWKEITDELNEGQTASDRPDIVARVFDQKLEVLYDKLFKENIFGVVAAYVSVIEFQKRGLPHCHMLIILKSEYKFRSSLDIDSAISAEIPNKETDPELYDIVTSCMVHRPCGIHNENSPCVRDGKCTKQYPKEYQETTALDSDSYPRYRRRNNGRTLNIDNIAIDNRWIVPFNPYLSSLFGCHINVEICALIQAVKYLYKYVYKGSDKASLRIVRTTEGDEQTMVDEISAYLDTRYVCAPEAAHRLFGFSMQKKSHTVCRLQVHLPDEQQVTFKEGAEEQAVQSATERKTNLTAYFDLNRKSTEMSNDPTEDTENMIDSRTLRYIDMPNHFVFADGNWKPRKQTGNRQIGRMYTVSPRDQERFCLRLLLLNRKGCTSFENLRTIEGVIYPKYVDAAKALGLFITDEYYKQCLNEAVTFQMPAQLRSLFATLLTYTELNNPQELWDEFKMEMSADFMHKGASEEDSISLSYYDLSEKLEHCGKLIENIITSPGPRPFFPENAQDIKTSKQKGSALYNSLNESQREIVDNVLSSLTDGGNKLYFIDGPGGSGKTYVYNTLYHIMHGRKLNILTVAWTGIAASLLPNGRTVNSSFKLIVEKDNKESSMKRRSKEAEALKNTDVIIWDEISMASKHALDAVDSLLKDIMQSNQSFGGKMIIIGGDFRQIPPIVDRGGKDDIVDASVKTSLLWNEFKQYTLSQNMRLAAGNHVWNDFLLSIGEGTCITNEEGKVELPISIMSSGDIIEDTYGDLLTMYDPEQMMDRCILSSRNIDVETLNKNVLNKVPGEERCYLSIDEVKSDDEKSQHSESLNFPTEFLNTMMPTGLPPHELHLKNGAIVMLLRNLDVRSGLCNGSRFIVTRMGAHILECKHACGARKGESVLIPRIDLYYDRKIPFRLRRRQFPMRLAFAVTIHKSQGQSFTKVGIDLTDDVFGHGQLYVALSRAKSMDGIKVLSPSRLTKNIVYKDLIS